MKKICYVVTLPVSIRAFFLPQLKHLASNGFDVTVICGSDDALESELGDGVHFYPCKIPRGLSVFGTVKAILRLKKLFKQQKFDLVQYSTPNASFCASIASHAAKVSVRVYHLMGFRYLGAKGFLRSFLKALEKRACSLSTHIECVSPSNLALGAAEKVFPADKATVVWNGSSGGVDLSRFDCEKRAQWRKEIREKLGISETEFVFGFAGRVTKDKGVNELLEAFSRLQGQSKLLIVGGAEGIDTLRQDLLQAAEASGRVLFHPAVTNVEAYFAAMDVLLLPSYREGFGNVIIEAAAMGIPAIVSEIPGPVDAVVKGQTALTVPPKDVSSLAAAMEQMRQADVGQMGENAAAFAASNFSSDVLCEKILERKRELLR